MNSRVAYGVLGVVSLAAALAAQAERPPAAHTAGTSYARISLRHPRDGHTVDFEAGYIRHLAFHQQANDTWTWYGWNITFGERQRWLVYASFGHSPEGLDKPVAPADDERDNVLNVAPHVDAWENGLYEFLPGLSRGNGTPSASARLELTTVDLKAGAAKPFEAALAAMQPSLRGETLWYRLLAGGPVPRFVRLRPRPSLAGVIDGSSEQPLPDRTADLIAGTNIEILTFRPTMSLGVGGR